ncbi:MAG: alpha/beta hydrolase, partial [Nonomuraea sp.]|nr:alpha/beta hydrolase [Nonomuraea sp.]
APLPLGAILRTNPVMLPFTADRALPGFMEWVGGEKFDADDPVAQVIMATLRDYKTALPAPQLFTDEQLRSLSVPALVVVGGRSVIHDPRRALERARALIPGVRAELWPDATHSIAGQFADEVDAKLLDFVDEVE